MSAEPSQIRKFFKNQTIFITGGSGFIGKVLIEKLLRDCQGIKKIYVLMRSKKNKTPKERFEELFSFACFDVIKSLNISLLEKVCLVNGDCHQPYLGLNDHDVDVLKKDTTVVIHAAANVKFDQTLKEATHNVTATRDVLELAQQMPNLRSFVYISTAFSNCLNSHIKEEFYEPPMEFENLLQLVNALDDDVLQDITPQLIGKWPNNYVYIKCICEDLVKTFGSSLPITVVRPAIVTSAEAEPMPGWNDNFYGPVGIAAGASLGAVRTLHAKPDATAFIVPVDYVSNCILAAACKRETFGTTTIYNYVGHKNNLLTWKLFADKVYRYQWIYPTDKLLWYPSFTLTENKLWNDICVFFLHTVRGYLADFFLFCVGQPTIAVKNYRRLNKLLDLISPFATRNWTFGDDNVMELWKGMNDEDKKVFNFDLETLDWDSGFKNAVSVGRVYLLKDPLDTVPRARRKLQLFFVLHYAILALLYYLLYKFVNFTLSLFL